MKKPRLTKRQKDAIEMIRTSGEAVVVENGWNVYLADSRQMPFGVSAFGEEARADVVLKQFFEYCGRAVADEYMRTRQAAAIFCGELAIEHIKAKRYEAARVELESAAREAFDEDSQVTLYRPK